MFVLAVLSLIVLLYYLYIKKFQDLDRYSNLEEAFIDSNRQNDGSASDIS